MPYPEGFIEGILMYGCMYVVNAKMTVERTNGRTGVPTFRNEVQLLRYGAYCCRRVRNNRESRATLERWRFKVAGSVGRVVACSVGCESQTRVSRLRS